MASSYPTSLDSFSTTKQDDTAFNTGVDTGVSSSVGDHAAHHNNLADAVNKVQAELGTNPSGASATVAAAITALETAAAPVLTNSRSASYTSVLGDADKIIEYTGASAQVHTVPTNASVAYPVNTIMEVSRYGAGTVTVAPVSGTVTIRSPGGLFALRAQYSSARLRKRATDEWMLEGDLA